MLKVDQIQSIQHSVLVEKKSIRQVAKETGYSRNTVRKYLQEGATVRQVLRPKQARKRRAQEAIQEKVTSLLESTTSSTTRKQQLTAAKVRKMLARDGVRASQSTVQRVLRERRRRDKEVFVPLPHPPGEEALVDFFEVVVDVGGQRRKVFMFLMRLPYSGRDFVWLYDRCDQVAFLDGHVRAFAYFGGVPRRMVYDNLTAAVRKVVPNRELAPRFQALACHYVFEPCFARPGQGHDKGGVESRGRHLRGQHLAPIPSGAHLDDISKALLDEVEAESQVLKNRQGKTVAERFEDERAVLGPLPATPFTAPECRPLSISSKSTFTFKGVTYSVPARLARLRATLYIGTTDLVVVCNQETVTLPIRKPGESGVQYLHYLPVLRHKPQAVRQVAGLIIKEMGEPFQGLWRLLEETHGGRNAARHFAAILSAVHDHGIDVVRDALVTALSSNRADLLALAGRLARHVPDVVVPSQLAWVKVEQVSANTFDYLTVSEVAS